MSSVNIVLWPGTGRNPPGNSAFMACCGAVCPSPGPRSRDRNLECGGLPPLFKTRRLSRDKDPVAAEAVLQSDGKPPHSKARVHCPADCVPHIPSSKSAARAWFGSRASTFFNSPTGLGLLAQSQVGPGPGGRGPSSSAAAGDRRRTRASWAATWRSSRSWPGPFPTRGRRPAGFFSSFSALAPWPSCCQARAES